MYNPQLDTFIKVAEAGSFNKAAEQLFISPPAVIKQINLLEAALDIRLFTRTHRGLRLTKAGASLYEDSKFIVAYCKDSVIRAKSADEDIQEVIRVGTSPMTPGQFVVDLQPKLRPLLPDMKFQFVPFENKPDTAKHILSHLGSGIDVVAGIFDDEYLKRRGCAGLALSDEPIRCAVSVYHKLAKKENLTIEDLYGEDLMIIRRNWNSGVDRMRDDIEANHPEIHITDFDFYDLDIFNQCENSNKLLMCIDYWASVHPLLKVMPVEWEHTMTFGLLHSPKPSPTVKKFLKAVRKCVKNQ